MKWPASTACQLRTALHVMHSTLPSASAARSLTNQLNSLSRRSFNMMRSGRFVLVVFFLFLVLLRALGFGVCFVIRIGDVGAI